MGRDNTNQFLRWVLGTAAIGVLFIAGVAAADADPLSGSADPIVVADPEPIAPPPAADPAPAPRARVDHGNITTEGISGMFLNPTTATLDQGELAVQYCAAIVDPAKTKIDNAAAHNANATVGVTDWLEVGGYALIVDPPSSGVPDIDTKKAGGPLFRVRLLEEIDWRPEVSFGGMFSFGDDALSNQTLWMGVSKRFAADLDFPLAFRPQIGFRQLWQDENALGGNAPSGMVGYLGGELELPKHIYLVSEVSTDGGNLYSKTPYSFGAQVRHPDGVGFSIAGIQRGDFRNLGILIGIGVNF